MTGPGGADPETKQNYITVNPAVYTDDFNRDDEFPLGGNWTTPPGCDNLVLLSFEIVPEVDDTISCAYWNANPFNDDQYSEVRIASFGPFMGPAVRIQTGGTLRNGYFVVIDNTTQIRILNNVDNNASLIPPAYTGLALQVDDTIRLSVVGDTLELFVEGVSQGTRTDTLNSHPSGVPGIYTLLIDSILDDWEGGNLE